MERTFLAAAALGTHWRKLRTLWILLTRVTLPYLRCHPGRGGLLTLSIAFGVAGVVATGSLVESSIASLEATWQVASGSSDLRISNGFAGVPDEILERVRETEGVAAAGAILTTTVPVSVGDDQLDLLVVAIDLLGDDSVHLDQLPRDVLGTVDELEFLSHPDAILTSRTFAASAGLGLGSRLEVNLSTGKRSFRVVGFVDPSEGEKLFGGPVALMDLPAAQQFFGREGIVEAIDVRVAANADSERVRERLATEVAGLATVVSTRTGTNEWSDLLFNARLILACAGAIAIVVGAVVVYHVMALASSQREPELDVVRSLGVSRRAILSLLLGEGILIGTIGAALGVAIGALLAWAAYDLVGDALATLYAPVPISAFRISKGYVITGASLGLILACLSNTVGALRATRLGAGIGIASPSLERWRRARRLAGAGIVLLVAGCVSSLFENRHLRAESLASLVVLGIALVLLGLALLAPVGLAMLIPVLVRRIHSPRLLSLRLGLAGLASDPGRASALLAAIMIGAGQMVVTVGVVRSVRDGIVNWIAGSQQADLVVTARGGSGFLPASPSLPAALEGLIQRQADVSAVDPVRLVAQPYEDRWVVVAAYDPGALGTRQRLEIIEGDLDAARTGMLSGDVAIASEHFAMKHDLSVGDSIELRSPTGPVRFRIGAVAVEYSGDLGTILVPLEVFRSRWRDDGVSAFYITVREGADAAKVQGLLHAVLAATQDCEVSTIAAFRVRASRVLDRVFYAAYALELIAAVVMVASVVSFFGISLGERRHEIALLRWIGATRAQLMRSFLCEAAAAGLVGGLLGSLAGLGLTWQIVKSAVRIGGGMNFDVVVPVGALVAALAAGVVVSIGAAAVPVWRSTGRMANGSTYEAND